MFRQCIAIPCLLLLFLAGAREGVSAEGRPTAPRLLPQGTLVYVRIEDSNEMRESMHTSGVGRMLQDEQLKPLVGDLYKIGADLFSRISDRVGVSLDELLSIPQGEIALAIVPLDAEEPAVSGAKDDSPEAVRERIEARRNQSPVGVVGFLDTGEKAYLMRQLIGRLESQIPPDVKRSEETVAGTKIVSYRRGGNMSESVMPIAYAERQGTFIFALGPELIQGVLERWDDGGSEATLAQNTDFGNVMSHCVGAETTRPQMTFFADPYHLAERLIKQGRGGAAGLIWPILENLKIEKIQAIGGSTFAGGEDEFEGIVHLHLLLGSPRDGLLSVVRPGEGPVDPEPWVPADVVSYTTFHWDLVNTYEGVGRIIGRFQSQDDFLEQTVEAPFQERTGVDLRADVLEQLTGRIGLVRWNEPPMRVNSSTQSWAFETKDVEAAQKTLEKIASAFGTALKKDLYAGKTIYTMGQPGGRNNLPDSFRRPEPTIAIIGNSIIGSDSRKAIEHLIQTEGGTVPRLADAADYALIAGEVSGKLDAEKPFLFSYLRSEEVFRQIYEMAKDPQNRQLLKQAGENNPVVKMLSDALEKNQLPAFSAFSKYFAPSGAFAYDDATGLHYATFTLKPSE